MSSFYLLHKIREYFCGRYTLIGQLLVMIFDNIGYSGLKVTSLLMWFITTKVMHSL